MAGELGTTSRRGRCEVDCSDPRQTRRRAVLRLLVLGAAAAVGSGTLSGARAQTPWSISLGVGYAAPLHGFGDAGGSYALTLDLFRRVRPSLQVGLEGGYHRLGTHTTDIPDFSGPGSSLVERLSWEMFTADALLRAGPASGRFRPYVVGGGGVGVARSRDRIHAVDASGAPLPMYAFDATTSSTHATATVGAGADLPDAFGRRGAGGRGSADFTGAALEASTERRRRTNTPIPRESHEERNMSVFSNPASATAEETQAYIDAILDLLGDRDPVDALASTPPALRRVLSEVPAVSLVVPEAAEKWSIRDVLRHLADSEIAWSWRLRMTLAQDRPRLTGWDQDAWADALLYATADAGEALATFEGLRRENVRLLRGVPDEALDRFAAHEERGEESVRFMTRLYAGHDLLHLQQIDRIRGSIGA